MASVVALAVSLLPLSGDAGIAIAISPAMMWLIPMGLFGTIGQIYMTRAMGKGDTQLISLVALSIIGFAAAYDYVLWGTRLDTMKLIGIAFIVAAVAVCSRSRGAGADENHAELATEER